MKFPKTKWLGIFRLQAIDLQRFFGVADGARTHDNRNHNPSPQPSVCAPLRLLLGIFGCFRPKHWRGLRSVAPHCFLLFSLTLTACGGGSDEDAATPKPADAPACLPVKIAAFGDSTMSGPERTKLMQGALDKHLGTGRAIVESRAASGYAAFELINGRDTVNQPYVDQLAITKPDIVLINHGLNDMAHGRPPEQYRADLDYLVTQAQTRGAIVVL